ncbi:MAG TPA: hypothetical protein PKM65_19185 [Spirochaetota bacterium]|nr:hypothetical protein [Spirochaetota bacterium]HNT11366.1 hypothetical protein [Spirochaetota bacterium]HOS40640.1 hypothetical protein [Spirochaetota bacterium]HPI21786.1 hypothetical protein [Spirochaetota bacterium]HPU89775.1 hypothetical protein [Spirochaetota bacterium]
MDKALLVKSVFLFILVWGVTIAFLWFRRRIEIFWKIIATLLFAFYVWFFFDEIAKGYAAIQLNWYIVVVDFVKELVALIFWNLFFLWPLALVVIFYKASDMGAEKLLKFMCVATLVLWAIVVVYVYFSKGIDEFMYQRLREMVPGAK